MIHQLIMAADMIIEVRNYCTILKEIHKLKVNILRVEIESLRGNQKFKDDGHNGKSQRTAKDQDIKRHHIPSC